MKLKTKIAKLLRTCADKLSPNPYILPNMKLGIYSETTVQIERLCQEHIISTRQYYEIPEEHRSEFVNMVMSDMAHDYVRTLWNRGLIKFATQMTDRGLRINSYMGVVNPPID